MKYTSLLENLAKSLNRVSIEHDLKCLADSFYKYLVRDTRCEYGGWGIDDKRPFGNSYVEGDILEIIDYKYDKNKFDDTPEEAIEYAHELYNHLGGYLKEKWNYCKYIGAV